MVRVAVGLAIVTAAVKSGAWWGFVGVAVLATATVRWCPLYHIAGFRTCRTASRAHRTRSVRSV